MLYVRNQLLVRVKSCEPGIGVVYRDHPVPVSLKLKMSYLVDSISHQILTPRTMHILRCMGSKFCVKFQKAPLKFHKKLLTHTSPNMHFTVFNFCVRVTISLNCDVFRLSGTGPRNPK